MLIFKYGVMNSGKTTNLLETLNFYEEKGFGTYLMKPEIDTKGNNEVVSRMGISRKVDYLIKKEDNLFGYIVGLFGINDLPDLILVDEVQFLTKDHIKQLFELSNIFGIKIICYGLRTDFQLEFFDSSSYLLSIADEIEEIKTICYCGNKATLNVRFKEGKIETEGEKIVIDNNLDVTYKSICPCCYFELTGKSLN